MKNRVIALFLLLAVLFTVPFWIAPSLDISISRFFYQRGVTAVGSELGEWPYASSLIWDLFYRGAPAIAVMAGLTGVALFVIGSLPGTWRTLRTWGVAVILSLSLGPGLVVNVIGKDHAGRPRPRQIVELGGTFAYRPPLMFGGDGKSFPCGHCSVGFVIGIFGLLLWRRNRWAAVGLFIASFVLGMLMGIGRVAAGAHFFSDVLWSGLITYAIVFLVYFVVLRVPQREDDPAKYPVVPVNGWLLGAGIGASVGALIGIALLATPFDQSLSGSLFAPRPESLIIKAPSINITVVAMDPGASGPVVSWKGEFKGFGFPGRRLEARPDEVGSKAPFIEFRKRGVFTDFEGSLTLEVDSKKVHAVHLRIPASASFTVRDESGSDSKLVVDRAAE